MAELKTVKDFENYLVGLENRMLEIATQMDAIKNGVGKQIVKRIQESALKIVGINIELPTWSVWFSLGAIGIIFNERERNKLKPFISELDQLTAEKQRILNELVYLKPREAAEMEAKAAELAKIGVKLDPLTGAITTIQRQINLDSFTETTGIPKLLRNLNIDPRFAYLVYPIGAFIGLKLLKKSKRRKK